MSSLDSTPNSRYLAGLLLFLFVGSGCAALIYEVVWFHILRLAIGSSAISLAILLASFMGGLFLGSLLFSRFVSSHYHPFKVYALLELGIAAFGILMPIILPAVSSFYVSNTGYGLINIMMRAIICAVCLLPATILMGATLPAISRWMETTRTGIAQVGFLYSANTIGAVIGTVLAGFYLLRVYDVFVATGVAVAINLFVGLLGLWLARGHSYQPVSMPDVKPTRVPGSYSVYGVIALSGLTALGGQVVWTRLLSLLFGPTVYTFSVILAVFLVGLGIGSSAGSKIARRADQPKIALGLTQLLLVLAIPYAAIMIKTVIPYIGLPGIDSSAGWVLNSMDDIFRCALAILPATVLWGASFPLALASNRNDQDPGYLVGRIYAANTVGAIFGALCFSLIVIPWLGTRTAEQGLTLLSAIAALLMFANVDWSKFAIDASLGKKSASKFQLRSRSIAVWPIAAILIVGVTGALVAVIPKAAPSMFVYGREVHKWDQRMLNLIHIAEGLNSTIAVSQFTPSLRQLSVSGKVVASSLPQDMRIQRMLGHFPALFHGRPKSVLIIGFGAGVTAGSFVMYPDVERIVIAEIEPEVPAASGIYFKNENNDVANDPRVEIILDDARHYITTTKEKFDIITTDPIHPWVKGAAALYSKEFFELAKSRLNPGGKFTQWIPLYETNEAAVKSEIATFLEVFPNGTVWNSDLDREGYDTVMVGGVDDWQFDYSAIQSLLDINPNVQNSLAQVQFISAADILKTFVGQKSDMENWLETAELNLDRNLRLEYLAGESLDLKVKDVIVANMTADIRYPKNLMKLSWQDEYHYKNWFEEHYKNNGD